MRTGVEAAARCSGVTRRTMVIGTCAAACGALTGCGTGGPGAPPAPGSPTPSGFGTAPAGATAVLAGAHDLPVGGGRVFPGHNVVVTRPAAEGFKAFDAICTHDGCTLTEVAEGTIRCPCHGSRFTITDGAVVTGPAKRALTPRGITVEGDSIILGS
jgi:Rieske Fe-S protein